MLGELISGGISLINGLFNRSSQEKANEANLAQARANNALQEKIAQQNLEQQREFAQQGIRWKVQDATAAGLHPLAALGSQVSSFSPISVGTSSADIKPASLDLGSMGQNIGRAIDAGSTGSERNARLQDAVSKLAGVMELERASLNNDLIRTQIAQTRSQIGPPIPMPRPGPDRTVGGVAVKEDDIKQKAEDFPATKVVRPFGYPLQANPWFNDGQQFEDRYGDSEIGSTIKFAINTLADHVFTGYGLLPETPEAMKRFSVPAGAHRAPFVSNSARR